MRIIISIALVFLFTGCSKEKNISDVATIPDSQAENHTAKAYNERMEMIFDLLDGIQPCRAAEGQEVFICLKNNEEEIIRLLNRQKLNDS